MSYNTIQFDDDDVQISVIGNPVQIGLTNRPTLGGVDGLISAVGSGNGASGADISVFVGEGHIHEEGSTGDSVAGMSLGDFIEVASEQQNGMYKIMTKADAPSPFVVQFRLRQGASSLAPAMVVTRLIVPDLSITDNLFADNKLALVSPLNAPLANVKSTTNQGVYQVLGQLSSNQGASYLPKLYGRKQTGAATEYVVMDGIEDGIYSPVCEGSIDLSVKVTITNEVVSDTSDLSGVYVDKFLPFVRTDSTYGFHVVPEIDHENDDLLTALVVDPGTGFFHIMTRETQVVSGASGIKLRLISDLVNFNTISGLADNATVSLPNIINGIFDDISFGANSSYTAGFRDLNGEGKTFTFDHGQTMAVAQGAPSDYLFNGASPQITMTVALANPENDAPVSAIAPKNGSFAMSASAQQDTVTFTRPANSVFAYNNNLAFDLAVAIDETEGSKFLNGELPSGSEVTVQYTGFLQGTHARASFRPGSSGEIEVNSSGNIFDIDASGGNYSAATKTVEFASASDPRIMRGDTVVGATDNTVVESASYANGQCTVVVRNDVGAPQTIKKDIVSHIDIISAIAFGDDKTDPATFSVAGNSRQKFETTVDIVHTGALNSGEYDLTFTPAVPAAYNFNAGTCGIAFPTSSIKSEFRDLDLFARGVLTFGATTTNATNEVTSVAVVTKARDTATINVSAATPTLTPQDVLGEGDGVTVHIVDTTETANVTGAGAGNAFIRGGATADITGDFKIESGEDDGDDHKLSFFVRYVEHQGGQTFTIGDMTLNTFALRTTENHIYAASQGQQIQLPFPSVTLSAGDDNEPDATDTSQITALSSEASVRQGLDGIDVQQAGTMVIAGSTAGFNADTEEIKTDAIITNYFLGSGPYTIGKVILVRDGAETNLHQTVAVSGAVPAGDQTFTISSAAQLLTTVYYEVGITEAQTVNQAKFAANTIMQLSAEAGAGPYTYTATLFKDTGDAIPVTPSQLQNELADGTSLTIYQKTTTNTMDERLVDGDKKVILKREGDNARIFIQQSAGDQWQDGDRIRFTVNNSGSGTDLSSTMTINVTTLRPNITVAEDNLSLEHFTHAPKFSVRMTVNNLDQSHAALLGDMVVKKSNNYVLHTIPSTTWDDGATYTAGDFDTGALSAPDNSGGVAISVFVEQWSGLTTSDGYDFYSGGDKLTSITATLVTGGDFIPDTAKAAPAAAISVTDGTTGFSLKVSDIINDALANGSRNAVFSGTAVTANRGAVANSSGSLDYEYAINKITTAMNGETVTVTITNQDRATYDGDENKSHSSLLSADQLTGADATLEVLDADNMEIAEADVTFTHTVTINVVPMFSLAFEQATYNLLGTAIADKFVKLSATKLDRHGGTAQLTDAGATRENDQTFYVSVPNASGNISTSFVSQTNADTVFASRDLNNPGASGVTASATVTLFGTPVKGDEDNSNPVYSALTAEGKYYLVADERLIPASGSYIIGTHTFAITNPGPATATGLSATASAALSLSLGLTLAGDNTNTAGDNTNTSFDVAVSFAAGATPQVTQADLSVSADSTVDLTWTYVDHEYTYTVADNNAGSTQGSETAALQWVLSHTVVNVQKAVDGIQQYYKNDGLDGLTGNISFVRGAGELITEIPDMPIGSSITLAYPTSGKSAIIGSSTAVSEALTDNQIVVAQAHGSVSTFSLDVDATASHPWVHGASSPNSTSILVQTKSARDKIAVATIAPVSNGNDDGLLLGNAAGSIFTLQEAAGGVVSDTGTTKAPGAVLVSYKVRVVPAIALADGTLTVTAAGTDDDIEIAGTWGALSGLNAGDEGSQHPRGALATINSSAFAEHVYIGSTFAVSDNDFYRTDSISLTAGDKPSVTSMNFASTQKIATFNDAAIAGLTNLFVSYQVALAQPSSYSTDHVLSYVSGANLELTRDEEKLQLNPIPSDGTLFQANAGAADASGFFLSIEMARNGVVLTTQANGAISFGNGVNAPGFAHDDDRLDINSIEINGAQMGTVDFFFDTNKTTTSLTADGHYALSGTAIVTKSSGPVILSNNLTDVDESESGANYQIAAVVGNGNNNLREALGHDVAYFALDGQGAESSETHSLSALRHSRGGAIVIDKLPSEPRPYLSFTNLTAVTAYQLFEVDASAETFTVSTASGEQQAPTIVVSGEPAGTNSHYLVIEKLDLSGFSGIRSSKGVSGLYQRTDVNTLKRIVFLAEEQQFLDNHKTLVKHLTVGGDNQTALQGTQVHMYPVTVDGNNHIAGGLTACGANRVNSVSLDLVNRRTVIAGLKAGTTAFEPAANQSYAFVVYAEDCLTIGFTPSYEQARLHVPERETELQSVIDFEARRHRLSGESKGANVEEYRPVETLSDISAEAGDTTGGADGVNMIIYAGSSIADAFIVPVDVHHNIV